MATDAWGIDDGWWAVDGHWQPASEGTVESLRAVMTPPDTVTPRTWFVREESGPPMVGRATVVLEDGTELDVDSHLPHWVPIGYHDLHHESGDRTTLIVTPRSGPRLPERIWGISCQVPSLRDAHERAIGGFGELAGLARWATERGASVLGLNPLGDPMPLAPRQASPYSTSSRRFLDPLLITLDEVTEASADIARAPSLIDRDDAWRAHRAALRREWERVAGRDDAAVGSFVDAHPELTLHATFNALVEAYGTGWPAWPSDLHDAGGDAVRAATTELADDVAFWSWVQWMAHEQLASVSRSIDLMFDLPVGVDPWGFDSWIDAPVLARNVSVGAPPDPFAPDGQNWGLPPYDPVALRAASYQPFLTTLRANLSRGAALRIDHVMQLFRLFWIPPDAPPRDGTYVRWHGQELLDLVVLEATRAGTWVVGEDLGTVEPGVRELLAERGVAGTKVAWFEDGPPSSWPEASLGTLSTHDLPTVMGALDGTDPRAGDMAPRMRDLAGSAGDDTEVLIRAHRALSSAGSAVVLAAFEDVVGSSDRVNLPGVNDYPSWRQRAEVRVEDLEANPIATAVTAAVANERHN